MDKKLLIVVNNLSFFISHRLEIGLGAIDAGYQVRLMGPDNPDAARQLESLGFQVEQIQVAPQDHGVIAQLRFLLSVYKSCRHFRPDICHMITLKTFLVAGVASRLARVPARLGSVSGLGYFFISPRWNLRLARFIYRPLFRFAMTGPDTEVIFQNDDDRGLLTGYAGIGIGNTHLIPGSGVNLKKFTASPEPQKPVVFVLIGRMLADKGVVEFVKAAESLAKSGMPARFVLAGLPDKTNPATISEDQLKDWNREGILEWIGFCSDVPALIAESHVVVLPSYREGFPKVLIEAAACGRPVITTDVPGCRHAIVNEVTGMLVPVRNPVALAKAMKRMALEDQTRIKMGANARDLAEQKYSVDRVVASHLDIYKSLLDSARLC